MAWHTVIKEAALEFLNVYGAPELIPRNEFRQRSLAGRYDNPIPPRFPAPIDFLNIPAQALSMLNACKPVLLIVLWTIFAWLLGQNCPNYGFW
jgi:hypothetical protein